MDRGRRWRPGRLGVLEGHPGVEVGVPVGVALGVPVGVTWCARRSGLGVPVGVALGVPSEWDLACRRSGTWRAVGVGLGVPRITGTQAENSDVLPLESVAVAVIT